MKSHRIVIVLALAASLLCSAGAFAQKHGRKGGLNLTADQKTQIGAIHEQQRAKMEELSKQSLTRAQFREQAAAIRSAGRQQVSSVLTPDQRAKVEARHANRKAARHGSRKTQVL